LSDATALDQYVLRGEKDRDQSFAVRSGKPGLLTATKAGVFLDTEIWSLFLAWYLRALVFDVAVDSGRRAC